MAIVIVDCQSGLHWENNPQPYVGALPSKYIETREESCQNAELSMVTTLLGIVIVVRQEQIENA